MILDEYLSRLSISEVPTPSLEALRYLQRQHILNVPFENLDIHYGNPIVIDRENIYYKIIKKGRGGFCYELNSQFNGLLQTLGFNAKLISGRVFDSELSVYGPEFDHLINLVELDGVSYLTDVGFGNFTFHPLNIGAREVQVDERGKFIVEQFDESDFRVDRVVGDQRIPVYKFTSTERTLTDFESMCNYHQKSPDSHFTKKRMISLAWPDGKVSIIGNKLKITRGDQQEEFPIQDEQDFDRVLWEYFKINASDL